MSKPTTIKSLIWQQNILSIMLLTVAVIVIWVGFTIYFSYSNTTITETDSQLIAPLNPRLDTTIFDRLKTRLTWTTDDLSNFSPNVQLPQTVVGGELVSATPRPTIKPLVEEASKSAKVASSSAQL